MTIKSANELLAKLTKTGGAITSSNSASEIERTYAAARGDFYIDIYGFGYILRPRSWLKKVCPELPSRKEP